MAKDLEGRKIKPGRIGDLQLVRNQLKQPRARDYYYLLRMQLPSGKEIPALFTPKQIADAISRAHKNPEDVTKADSLLNKLADWLD